MSLALRIEEAAFEGEGPFFEPNQKKLEQRGEIPERAFSRPSSQARPLGDADFLADLEGVEEVKVDKAVPKIAEVPVI